jgi:uncharacterized protein
MPVFLILVLLGTGLAIGLISGLLGIGGGIVMTPVQYWIYTSSGMSVDLAIKISFATTLAVILPTAASGVWQHHKQGGIYWRIAIFMGVFTAIGSFGGSFISAHVSGSVLKIAFGVFTLIIAIRMLTIKVTDRDRPIRENLWLWFALALPIGIITGILGIGGGIVVIPVLILVLRLKMCDAIGTSLGMMLFTSVGGIIGYVINGATASGLPPYTIGYIYWPAWIALSVTSIGMAQVGAILSHRLPGKQLNYIFIALLFYISLDMLGVIDLITAHFS